MSLSGVGGTNPWLPDWIAISKVRSDSAAQKVPSSASALGQLTSASALAQAPVQSMTGASGGQLNSQDSKSFSQSMASLTQAIQGGDVGTAQDAFSKAKALLQSAGVHGHHHHHHGGAKPASSTDTTAAAASAGPADPFASAFGDIGQALQAGDLALAQTALTRLNGLLQDSTTKPTGPPVGVNRPASPAGGVIDLTA